MAQNRFMALANGIRPSIKELTVAEIRQKIHDGDQFLMIDIREPAEWLKGHVAPAIHISRGTLEQNIERWADPSTPMVLYCGGGYRSVLAADSLQRMGYQHVYCMVGGYQEWLRHPHDGGFRKLVAAAGKTVRAQSIEQISPRLARVVLIDVREVGEWRKGTIPKAINMPRGVLENLIEGKVPDEKADIVLFCGAGSRSTLAAESLAKMGYSGVTVMAGGFQAWKKQGLPVETPTR
ncbi:MAG TPA: rhodanese-like domain-containing protein [Candidatus Xenobia bacterium]